MTSYRTNMEGGECLQIQQEVPGDGKTPEANAPPVKKRGGLRAELIFLLIKAGVLAGLLAVTFLCIFGIARSPDQTMSPAFKDGDLVLYYRLDREFAAQDVVVLSVDGETQVRRIIAVPGDEVDIDENGLKLNGYYQSEQNIYTATVAYEEGIRFPITLGEGEYFVLADNRTNATDSRIYGAVTLDQIKGSVMTILRRRGF